MRRVLVALAACAGLLSATSAVADTGPERVQVAGIGSGPGGTVSLVATVQPAPVDSAAASTPAFSVTSGGATLAASVSPVLSARTPVLLVVDASTVAAATGLLLQLPPDSPTGVIAASGTPRVVSPPAAGVADDVRALSSLDIGGRPATGKAVGEAVDLALRRLPGPMPVLAVFTAARDAGGDDATELAQRIREAGAVLAVVTTSPSPYWREVAGGTGGLAVRADARREVPASDQLADALRARYRVGFARPAGDQAELRLAGGASTRFDLPPRPASHARIWWMLAAGLLLAVAVLGVVALWRRRGRRLVELVDDVVPVDPMPGVRVFDVPDSGAPMDVTNSLFEPRAVRDARERAEPGRAEAAGPGSGSG